MIGEWVTISRKAYKNLYQIIDGNMNTRDFGRVKLLFIYSRTIKGRHIMYNHLKL